jgi:hypothetical protein
MMRAARRRLLVLFAAAACAIVLGAGCALFGGQTGQESKSGGGPSGHPPCEDAGMGPDTVDAGVEDVISALGEQFTAPFVWVGRQTATDVAIELTYDADRAYRKAERCAGQRLEIPVTLSIATGDGLLDERVTTTLSATGGESGVLEAVIQLADVRGTYDASEIENADPSNTELRVMVTIDAGRTRGEIHVITEHSSNGVGMADLSQAAAWPERL